MAKDRIVVSPGYEIYYDTGENGAELKTLDEVERFMKSIKRENNQKEMLVSDNKGKKENSYYEKPI